MNEHPNQDPNENADRSDRGVDPHILPNTSRAETEDRHVFSTLVRMRYLLAHETRGDRTSSWDMMSEAAGQLIETLDGWSQGGQPHPTWQDLLAQTTDVDQRSLLTWLALVDESPLGTAQARRLRDTTPASQVMDVLTRAGEAARPPTQVVLVNACTAAAENVRIDVKELLTVARGAWLDTVPLTAPLCAWQARRHGPEPVESRTLHLLVPGDDPHQAQSSSDAGEDRDTRPGWTSDEFRVIVRDAARGDRSRVEELFVWFRPLVVRYSRCRIGSTQEDGFHAADDLAQDACRTALHRLYRYADKPAEFLPGLYELTADKVAEFKHAAPTQVTDSVAPAAATRAARTAPPTDVLSLADRLTSMLEDLPGQQREVAVLRLVVGLSVQETAHTLRLQPSSVRSTQHRALAKLRTTLAPLTEPNTCR